MIAASILSLNVSGNPIQDILNSFPGGVKPNPPKTKKSAKNRNLPPPYPYYPPAKSTTRTSTYATSTRSKKATVKPKKTKTTTTKYKSRKTTTTYKSSKTTTTYKSSKTTTNTTYKSSKTTTTTTYKSSKTTATSITSKSSKTTATSTTKHPENTSPTSTNYMPEKATQIAVTANEDDTVPEAILPKETTNISNCLDGETFDDVLISSALLSRFSNLSDLFSWFIFLLFIQ